MNVSAQFGTPLRMESDPFAAGAAGPHLGRSLQTAFREIVRHVTLQTPVVLVTGGASTGKTLLVDMTARTCAEMGLSVQRVNRGDLVHIALGQRTDVLLIDEANSVSDSMLEALSPGTGMNTATTTVLFGLSSCAGRIDSAIRPVIVELTPLSALDARNYLLGRAAGAGFPDLFTADALDVIVAGSLGSPRLLWSIASFAFFRAASEGASQIGSHYASYALQVQIPSDSQNAASLETPDEFTTIVESSPNAQDSVENNGIFVNEDDTPAENRNVIEFPSGVQMSPETIHGRLSGETPGEWRSDPEQFETVFEHSSRPQMNALTRRKEAASSSARTAIIYRTLVATGCLIVASAAILIVMPSILADTGSSSGTPPASQSVPVQASGVAGPALAFPPGVFDEAARIVLAAPTANGAQNVAADETNRAPSAADAPRAAQSRSAARVPLTREEEAAIARGVQELERAGSRRR